MQTGFVGGTPFGRVSTTITSSPGLVCSSPPSPYVCLSSFVWATLTATTYRVTGLNVFESMTDAEVQAELMDVLHTMYPDMTDIPEPTSILFHRWYNDPLTRGSYSNWPASFFQEHHDNLRAPSTTGCGLPVNIVLKSTSYVLFFFFFLLVPFSLTVSCFGFRDSCMGPGTRDEMPAKSSRNVSRVEAVLV
jgi:hypothetical protein